MAIHAYVYTITVKQWFKDVNVFGLQYIPVYDNDDWNYRFHFLHLL